MLSQRLVLVLAVGLTCLLIVSASTLNCEDVSNVTLGPMSERCPDGRGVLRNGCNSFIRNMKQAASEFTSCLMSSVKPACFCELCYDKYYKLTQAYCSIQNNDSCRPTLLAGDNTFAIEAFYSFAKAIWETKGRCSSCFESSTNFTVSSRVETFYDKVYLFDRCVNNLASNSTTVCKSCRQEYLDLLQFYDNKFGRDPSKVCADVADRMNASMCTWTHHNCTNGKFQILTVSLFTSGVLLLTALFYVCVYLWGRRQQKMSVVQSPRRSRSKSKSHSRSHSPDEVFDKRGIESQRDLSSDSATLN